MQDFKKLKIWQCAHNLVMELYSITSNFSVEELYGIKSQIRRAAVSIPTNIAEGCGRETSKDFARFLQIGLGSCCEVEYLLLLSKDLDYLDEKHYGRINDELILLKKMIYTLIKKARISSPKTEN